ncbi:unnamed protein product, partial [Prorocentrum cordatum]
EYDVKSLQRVRLGLRPVIWPPRQRPQSNPATAQQPPPPRLRHLVDRVKSQAGAAEPNVSFAADARARSARALGSKGAQPGGAGAGGGEDWMSTGGGFYMDFDDLLCFFEDGGVDDMSDADCAAALAAGASAPTSPAVAIPGVDRPGQAELGGENDGLSRLSQ